MPLSRLGWLDPAELRIGLGCMRLSTDEDFDQSQALATIVAAAEAGITVFDTAHAYAPEATQPGHNERLLARALRGCGRSGRVITKGGMTRAGGGWVPDGRAKAVEADCEASLVALDGLGIDVYLLHAPDPRRSWLTSVRALARLADQGQVRRVGVSNVNRAQLEQACAVAPIAAVELALSPLDDRAIRGGVLGRCLELGIAVIAHSPLGGVRRAGGLARRPELAAVAERTGATAAEVTLAWLLGLSELVVAIPGARRPETARSAARAATLTLSAEDRRSLPAGIGGSSPRRAPSVAPAAEADVVLVMGIPGAGKSRIAADHVRRGYDRLNRDELGGSLRDVAELLDRRLSEGALRVVLDNTFVSRVARSYFAEVAARHGVPIRCIWLDAPLAEAQVNLVARIIGRFGGLANPEDLRAVARREPGLMLPTSQMRVLRELEPPSDDEGFTAVERVPFVRDPAPERGSEGVLVAAAALERPGWEGTLAELHPGVPHLIFDWRPGGATEDLTAAAAGVRAHVRGPVEVAVCPHPAGPPACWCRPPLPGLPLAFARAHGVNRLSLLGTSPAHRTLARSLGAIFVEP